LMSARLRAGPPLGGFSLGDFSPGGPALEGPPVSVPEGFGVVPIPGVGVMLDGLPVPIPGVGVGLGAIPPVPIPGAGAKPVPPPPVPGEGARPPRVPCAKPALALAKRSTAAKVTAILRCIITLPEPAAMPVATPPYESSTTGVTRPFRRCIELTCSAAASRANGEEVNRLSGLAMKQKPTVDLLAYLRFRARLVRHLCAPNA